MPGDTICRQFFEAYREAALAGITYSQAV